VSLIGARNRIGGIAAMGRVLAACCLMVAVAAAADERPAPARFDGKATLAAPPPSSADGRYDLKAELTPALAEPSASADGTLSLSASLVPNSQLAANCVVERVFADGFESP